MGLGRSVFAILERGLVAHALETVQARLAKATPPTVASFVTAAGAQLLRVHLAPVLGARATADAEDQADRDVGEHHHGASCSASTTSRRQWRVGSRMEAVLQSLTDASRRALANIRAAGGGRSPSRAWSWRRRPVRRSHPRGGRRRSRTPSTGTRRIGRRSGPSGCSRTCWGPISSSAAASGSRAALGLSTVHDAVDPRSGSGSTATRSCERSSRSRPG